MDVVPVKAYIPRDLRRQVFSRLALREMTFSAWVRVHLVRWLEEERTAPEGGQRGDAWRGEIAGANPAGAQAEASIHTTAPSAGQVTEVRHDG